MDDPDDDGMLLEYDFTNAVRGKHAGLIPSDAVMVTLEADVARDFPTAQAVNDALRLLSNLKKQLQGVT